MITEWTIRIEWNVAENCEPHVITKNTNDLEDALKVYTMYAQDLLKKKVKGEVKDYQILMYQLQGWIEG